MAGVFRRIGELQGASIVWIYDDVMLGDEDNCSAAKRRGAQRGGGADGAKISPLKSITPERKRILVGQLA